MVVSDWKTISIIVVVGTCGILSANAIAQIGLRSPSLQYGIDLVAGFISTLVLAPQGYWRRVFETIFVVAGVIGLVRLLVAAVERLLFAESFSYTSSQYALNALVCIGCTLPYAHSYLKQKKAK